MLRRKPLAMEQTAPRRKALVWGVLVGLGCLTLALGGTLWLRVDRPPTPVPEVVMDAPEPSTPVAAAPALPAVPQLHRAYSTPPRLTANLERLAAPGSVKAIVVSASTQSILWAKNESSPAPIASMTKMMSVLVALDMIERRPEVTLDTPIAVSLGAMQMGGSQLWLEAGTSYPLRQMLMGMMLASANDAAYAVAENLAPDGQADTFVALMNRRARELGLERARYYNPHGMPADIEGRDNLSTPLDQARLAMHLLQHPLFMEMASTWNAPFVHTNGTRIEMYNHNRLLKSVVGVTGMKTGFINRSGYCSTITATRGGRTLIVVAMGLDTRANRDLFVTELLDWGFRQPDGSPTVATATGQQ
jgi:D-alanyl-D-alanine carboxypeptidase